MEYNPLYLVSYIRDMFQAMFFEYGGSKYAWDPDPKASKIRVGTVNDVHDDARTQMSPRILVQRGGCQMGSQFINNNHQNTIGGGLQRPGGQEEYRQDIQGVINIIIETRQEGSCEEVAEIVRKFLCWCKPYIESQFGFQAFGKQINVSECNMDTEDTEKFKINISIPYIVEDRWRITGNLTRLNHIFQELNQTS